MILTVDCKNNEELRKIAKAMAPRLVDNMAEKDFNNMDDAMQNLYLFSIEMALMDAYYKCQK